MKKLLCLLLILPFLFTGCGEKKEKNPVTTPLTWETIDAIPVATGDMTEVQLRQIEVRQQGPDHPILWNVPETDYLGFYIFQIV